MRAEADECICLVVPEVFCAVGEWYIDFRQTGDAEVQEILKSSRSLRPLPAK
jgi:predicted phosphoribosyltransferase